MANEYKPNQKVFMAAISNLSSSNYMQQSVDQFMIKFTRYLLSKDDQGMTDLIKVNKSWIDQNGEALVNTHIESIADTKSEDDALALFIEAHEILEKHGLSTDLSRCYFLGTLVKQNKIKEAQEYLASSPNLLNTAEKLYEKYTPWSSYKGGIKEELMQKVISLKPRQDSLPSTWEEAVFASKMGMSSSQI